MPSRRLIREGWYQYSERILPAGASDVQKQETRRAFYAGAAHLWDAFISALGPGEEADPPDLALAEGVDREIKTWLGDMESGRA